MTDEDVEALPAEADIDIQAEDGKGDVVMEADARMPVAPLSITSVCDCSTISDARSAARMNSEVRRYLDALSELARATPERQAADRVFKFY